MTIRTFEPMSRSRRIWSDLQRGLIVGTGFFILAFLKTPHLPLVAALIGLVAGCTTFASLAFNQPEDLQSVEISAQKVIVANKGTKKSLCWNEIAKAYCRSYEGTRWVFVSPGKSDVVFMVEGFSSQQEDSINSLIKMNLELNKVEMQIKS